MADFGELTKRIAIHNTSLPNLVDEERGHLQLDSQGRLLVTTSGTSLDISATDLDIRDLDASQDNVAISDGTDTLAVNGDGSINAVVTATDLDIRDLSHTTDSVAIGDGTETVNVTANGELEVYIPSGVNVEVDLDHTAGDSVQIGDGTDILGVYGAGDTFTGDTGLATLAALRDDALTTLSEADGTLTHLRVDSTGQLYVTGSFSGNESGTEADTRADETDGVVSVTNSFTTLATVAVGAGTTLYIVGANASSNVAIDCRLITNDSSTVLRRWAVPAGDTVDLNFLRAIEVAGSASETVTLQARVLNAADSPAQVAGGFNAYSK